MPVPEVAKHLICSRCLRQERDSLNAVSQQPEHLGINLFLDGYFEFDIYEG